MPCIPRCSARGFCGSYNDDDESDRDSYGYQDAYGFKDDSEDDFNALLSSMSAESIKNFKGEEVSRDQG